MNFRRPYIKRITCIVALCASSSFTFLILSAGIAAACSGPGDGECTAAPTVTTTAATSITESSAYLNGDINPNGCVSTYVFSYRQSGGPWIEEFTRNISGSATQPVSEWEPSLQPSTTYEFKLSATNTKGTTTATRSFTTKAKAPDPKAPIVSTEAASGITSSGARLNASVNPNGYSTNYTFEYGTKENELSRTTPLVSAGSEAVSQKVTAEVSLEPATKYYFRIHAANTGGTKLGTVLNFTTSTAPWQIKESPNPGTSDNYLYDVSCEPSTSVCTSVGKSVSSGVDSPMALRWNGTTWSQQSPAKKSGTLPTRLLGVDCPSETRCLAAGNYQPSEGGPAGLTELWNEGKWNVQSTPIPAEATSSEYTAIGCNSTANCTAVGSATIGGKTTAIAARWTSPNWALSSIPIPEGAKSSQLDGVDCLWSNFCVAVGRYTASNNLVRNLVLFWNGEWALQTVNPPSGAWESSLLDVSCTPSPSRCMAAGTWKNIWSERFTLAYRFNGTTTWTLQSTPNPLENQASVFQEVSCATETSCTAVGSWNASAEGPTKTLAADWNGSSWSLQGTSNPAGAAFSSLFGVSCRSTSCMGVGWSSNGSEVDTTLSEFRE